MGFTITSITASYTKMMIILMIILLFEASASHDHHHQLSKPHYQKSCPNLFTTVQSVVKSQLSKEPRIGASLLRLHFHDCFVNGCDGSVLLEDSPSLRGEQTAIPNNNSLRGFHVIHKIKSKVEKLCPHLVSCADLLTIAARDSVLLLGGPYWDVKLGRRDSKRASFSEANRTGVIPSFLSSLPDLIQSFTNQGLSSKDMVALSGAHTIGLARCNIFRERIYEESNIESEFAKKRQKECPKTTGDENVAPLDLKTPTSFDNKYFKNLIKKKGLLHSDQILFNAGSSSTHSLVLKYSQSLKAFHRDFVKAMIKMADIKPLTGSQGEIRINCRKPN